MNQRGAISLVFDDGYQTILDTVVPLLDKYNLPGVFAIPLDGQSIAEETGHKIAPAALWQQKLTNTNHEIAAHSIDHTDLTTLSSKDLEKQLTVPAEQFQATTLVYPGGGYNQSVINTAKNNYQAARTVKRGMNKLPPEQPYELKSYNWTQKNFSPLKANLLAFKTKLTNAWLIETFHLVEEKPSITHSIKIDQLEKHLVFLANKNMPVQTMAQVLNNAL